LRLHKELNGVYDAFHVSNLKKCLADPTLQLPLDEIQVDAKLYILEEHVEILKREFKKMKRSRVNIVKVWWNLKRGLEFKWEREDQMKIKSCADVIAFACDFSLLWSQLLEKLKRVVSLLEGLQGEKKIAYVKKNKVISLGKYDALMNELVNDGIKLSQLEINTSFINGLPKKWLAFCQSLRNTNHVKESELASLFAPSSSSGKNKGLITKTYDWDEEEVSFDDNEVPEVKALMALDDEERVFVSKESTRNSEWIKISMKTIHTLLEMEDKDDTKSFLDYMCIDLNYLLVFKQAKLDLLAMQHGNTKILKENQNLRNELKELTSITEAWLNSSNKVNPCISEQIPTQKKKILWIDQLTEDTSSSGLKDPVFVKFLADNSEVSITGSNKPKLSEAEDSTLSNHDTGKHPLPPLEKLPDAEPVSGPKTIKSILKSKSTFKTKTLKGITINEPFSAPARGNKSSSVSKTNSAPAGKLKKVKIDDPPLAIVMKELN
nr:putative reverse transcriptase domain-containing protein [Tanacetum cinerariifolium]